MTLSRFRGKRQQDWKTPSLLKEELNREFHFDYDPCTDKTVWDGLLVNWGRSNFVNPPYSGNHIYDWLKKGLEEKGKGNISVFLLPSRTGTKWFHDIVLKNNLEIRWLRGRLRFDDCDVNAPFDSMLVIIR